LAGRQAWSGNSGGFTNTMINMPAAAGGQLVQLKWRCGSDSSFGVTGWYVDSISVSARSCCVSLAPTLLLPKIDTNGYFACILSGNPGPYLVETGTNLLNWTTAGTVTNVTGQVPFIYPVPLDGARVFRAKTIP
jgi:hypothetical protein